MISEIEKARNRYQPEVIKCLLIAEAPPKENSGRFFYFDEVRSGDSLFLETMKVLYPSFYAQFKDTQSVRNNKSLFLKRFKEDGYYLIDASKDPMENTSTSAKLKQLREHLPQLITKLNSLVTNEPIVLISAPVYKVCYPVLKKKGFHVLNNELVDFPGSGGQKKFRQKFEDTLSINNLLTR